MSATAVATVKQSDEQRDALAGRIFESMVNTMDLFTMYLGVRLKLYQAIAQSGPSTAAELAQAAGIHERYAREWLEQQAVSGILEVDDAAAEASLRRYSLPAGHAEVLLDGDSMTYMAPLSRFAGSLSNTLPKILEAFRTGGGVSWSDYGADAREAQAEFNRPLSLHVLAKEWLPTIQDVHARLQMDPPARVADIGCGAGWTSIGISQAYPKVRVDGFDLDEPSVELATANAAQSGVADRVTFQVADLADSRLAGQYDLVVGLEMVHDLSRPVEVLRGMRGLLAENGAVIIIDERVRENFTAPGDALERLFYGFSVLCCLPTGMSEQPTAATGTVMRPETLRRYAVEAGFQGVEILPIEHEFFRLYRLIG